MTTTEDLELIPKEFCPALDAQPDDMVLRGAIVDRLLELGDEVGAECLRWSIDKNRHTDDGGWAGYNEVNCAFCLPYELWDAGRPVPFELDWKGEDSHRQTRAFRRLIYRWKHSTPEQRQEYWNWQPPQ